MYNSMDHLKSDFFFYSIRKKKKKKYNDRALMKINMAQISIPGGLNQKKQNKKKKKHLFANLTTVL